MVTRREVLKTGAAAAAGAACLPAAADAEPTLPASIQALKSLRELARPITAEERRQRIERARQLMTVNKLDAIFMIGGSSLVYFANVSWWNSERLGALILPAKGEPFFVVPAFEEERLREQLANGPFDSSADVRVWQEDEDPYRLVAQGLKDRGISSGTLGMEERVAFVFSNGVAQAVPALKMVSATPATAGCRMVKSAHELELMKLANQATWTVYRAVYQAMSPGMTQHDVGALISAAYEKVGFRGGASVQVGEYTALPHGSRTPQVIHEGTPIMIDDGCTVEGYNSDITRTWVLGKAGDQQKRVFEIVQRAQRAALAAAKPGVACQAVDAAARQVITDAGYGPGYKFFGHRVGHGIGMDGHEWPYLVRGNALPLAPGMTFSDEPGIYIRGEFGVRLEDDIFISENGAEMFTTPSPSMEHPFG
ncbi:MAG: Xaa-Pro peptidase family protein [Acidobacteriia bacterium]|nr:Xaa-Pro peptidase family protein [Terriglobia bacterium]